LPGFPGRHEENAPALRGVLRTFLQGKPNTIIAAATSTGVPLG